MSQSCRANGISDLDCKFTVICYIKLNCWSSHISPIEIKAPIQHVQGQRKHTEKKSITWCTATSHTDIHECFTHYCLTAQKALWHYNRQLRFNTQTHWGHNSKHGTLIIASEPIICPTASVQEISTANKLAQSELQLTRVPEQTLQLTHKASAAHLYLFKGHNQSFPQTQKTHELNFQGQLFISNERHRAPLTNWHLSEKCVTLTTARLVRLSKWV